MRMPDWCIPWSGLLHGEEIEVFAERCYQGVERRPEVRLHKLRLFRFISKWHQYKPVLSAQGAFIHQFGEFLLVKNRHGRKIRPHTGCGRNKQNGMGVLKTALD